jgi:hypothetical protein
VFREEKRDSAFGFQCGEWLGERRFRKIIRRFLERWEQLLRWRLRLQLADVLRHQWHKL